MTHHQVLLVIHRMAETAASNEVLTFAVDFSLTAAIRSSQDGFVLHLLSFPWLAQGKVEHNRQGGGRRKEGRWQKKSRGGREGAWKLEEEAGKENRG